MKEVILTDQRSLHFAYSLLKYLDLDGSNMMTLKKVPKTASDKQNRLRWKWYGELAGSGVGFDDTKIEVAITAKIQFIHPILMRDDKLHIAVYNGFIDRIGIGQKEDYIRRFADNYIHTGNLTMYQSWESLKDFEMFWVREGVNLTDPKLMGVDTKKYKFRKNPKGDKQK